MVERLLPYLIPVTLMFGLHVVVPVQASDMAHGGPTICDHCRVSCATLVACVVMVPMEITETRMKSHVVTTIESREETYTVFERRPVTRQFKKTVCYLDDEIRTKTITQQQCRMVTNPVITTHTVKVPVTEFREGIEEKTVCTKEGPACVTQPYAREVTVEVPEVCTQMSEVPDVVFDTTSKEISYHVRVPRFETVDCAEETVYKLFPIERTRMVEVCVPKIVKVPVDVTVCKMVPQTIHCCPACSGKFGKHPHPAMR